MRGLISLITVFCLAALLAANSFAQCGPNGCRLPNNGWYGVPTDGQIVKEKTKIKRRPTHAWRYRQPEGHLAAVVRIHCCDSESMQKTAWSHGSGVLVRWKKRIVVLTARHVVQDAKNILVDFFDGQRRKARVMRVNRKWDCAVLDIGKPPKGIEPAELAMGNDAKFNSGDRMETCGYGPDGKLACNVGSFKGYRQLGSDSNSDPWDWMAVSGNNRAGDSGGPIFNADHKLVGVAWGSNAATGVAQNAERVMVKGGDGGPEVVGVQAGLVHKILDDAIVQVFTQKKTVGGQSTPPQTSQLVPVNWKRPTVEQTGFGNQDRDPLLNWRREAEAKDRAIMQRLERQSAMLDAVSRQKPNRPSTNVDVSIERPAEKQKPANELSPLLGGLVVMASIAGGCFIYFGAMKG